MPHSASKECGSKNKFRILRSLGGDSAQCRDFLDVSLRVVGIFGKVVGWRSTE